MDIRTPKPHVAHASLLDHEERSTIQPLTGSKSARLFQNLLKRSLMHCGCSHHCSPSSSSSSSDEESSYILFSSTTFLDS